MKYAIELECIDKAVEYLKNVRYWLEKMAGYKDEPIPHELETLEGEMKSIRDRMVGRCESVKNAFEYKHGYFSGVHIQIWNPNIPKHQTVHRAYIRSPDIFCDEPHMTKFEYETMCKLLGCDEIAYEEPFDVYVMEGKRVFKILKGGKNGREQA